MKAYLDVAGPSTDAEEARRLVDNPRRARENYAPDFSIRTLEGKTLALDARLVVVGAVLDDGCAMRAHCRDLDGISAAGHDDRHRDPEGLPGVRERLAVITGRRRDHAVARGRVATEKVEPTADLERRGR